MKKKLLIILLVSLFSVPLFVQTTQVYADVPVTSPITAFILTGKVTYKQLGRVMKNVSRFTPAKNVLIKVINFFDHTKHYQTTTDAQGNYGLNIPNGLYTVEASDSMHTFFTPPFKVVKINNNAKVANFEGLIFP